MKNTSQDLKNTGKITLNKLTAYLAESQSGTGKVLQQKPANELAKELNLDYWIKKGGLTPYTAEQFLDAYLANTQHMHHPHYMGHQVAVPHIASGIADFVHGVINNPMAIYEMGPAGAVIEQTIINWMLDKVGWFKGRQWTDFTEIEGSGGGILTHGGSLANLTAMLAARAAIAPESWEKGITNDLVVFCPEVSHYSVARAISIIGLGSKSVIPIATDKLEILKPEALSAAFQKIKNDGKKVMAVIVNACATATGLYDPIDEVGHFCEENGLWFHIDGAHGASALISNKERHWMKGVERANSLIWDTHKMLRTSTLCAGVLFKDYRAMTRTFQQKGSYLFHEKEQPGFDLMPYAIECTKAAIATKLFWVLAAEGEEKLAQFIENQYLITREFYGIFQKHPDFHCPYYPQSNILCFQYTKYGTNNAFQLAIRNEIVKRGNFYLSSTEISGIRYLRLTLINPLTKVVHIKGLIAEIMEVANALIKKSNLFDRFSTI